MSPDTRPTLVVVGASGYLGRRLVALARADYRVVATYHSHPQPSPQSQPSPRSQPAATDVGGDLDRGTEWRALDVRDTAAIEACIAEAGARVVVNCAYVQRGPDLTAITATAPGVLAAAAQQVDAQFVQVSSDVVFPGRTDRPYREDDDPSPVHDYGRAKLRAEQLVAAAHEAPLIIRTSLIYGGEVDGPQERMVRAALDAGHRGRGHAVHRGHGHGNGGSGGMSFFTDEVRNPIRVGDLASAILELVTVEHHGLLHVAGADALDRLTFAQLLAGAMHADAKVLRGRPSDPSAGPRPGNLALDCSRARSILTTRLTGAREALSTRD